MSRGKSTRTKKFMDILWTSKEGVEIKVPVSAITQLGHGGASASISFRAKYEEADLDVEASDIEEVRKKVIEKLVAWHSIAWTLWIKTSVSGGKSTHQAGAGFRLEFEWEYVAIGTNSSGKQFYTTAAISDDWAVGNPHLHKWNSEEEKEAAAEEALVRGAMKALKDLPGKVPRFGGIDIREGAPPVGKEEPRWRISATKALIPLNEENVRMMIKFRRALGVLMARMEESFHPDMIQDFLKQGVLPALTSGGK